MKKKNRNHRRQTRIRKSKKPSIEFSTLTIPAGDHNKFKAGVLKVAARSVTEFPQTLELVRKQFQLSDPLGIVASFAIYGLRKDVHQDSPLNNIQQHHAELLQSVLLTIPSEEWGTKPLTPNIMQTVFDAVPKLSETFFHQRILAEQKITDEHESAVLSLQDRIRLHTQAVRNWGYFTDIIRIAKELYGPLDAPFSAHYGFGISDLVQVIEAVVVEYERRANEHFSTLRKVCRGTNTRKIVKLYYDSVPDLVGKPEEMIAALPSGITREGLLSRLMAHLNLRLSKRLIFKADEVAALTAHPPELVETILRAISLPPGNLVDAKPEHLFLGNPIWTAPGIDLGESFFIAMPQVVFSHIHPLVTRLGEVAGLKVDLEKTRSHFLESKLGEALSTALPSATISANVKWRSGSQEFETDYLAIIDRIVVIAEAKSHRLTPEGMRGAPDRVKRHIQDLVLVPSIQSSRLEKLIVAAQIGDETSRATVRGLGIDALKIDRVIRLSVTLDDLSVLCSAEGEFKRIGWVPADHDLAPTISIADFMCVIDILDSPIPLLHYLSERKFVQKSFKLLGDEMDFLGLYLETGFNLAAVEKQHDNVLITELSGQIDRYYDSRDVGMKLAKPMIKLRPLFRNIVERISQRRPEGWTIVGLHLLNSADYAEQQKMEKALTKLRRMVQKNYRDPAHVNSLQIQPLKRRKAWLIFYLYPNEMRPIHKAVMERLASEALNQSQSEECCVFGRCIDNWQMPYEALCVVRKPKATVNPA